MESRPLQIHLDVFGWTNLQICMYQNGVEYDKFYVRSVTVNSVWKLLNFRRDKRLYCDASTS